MDWTFDARLFSNDFSVPGTFKWFAETLSIFILIFLLARGGCAFSTDRIIKSLYFAIEIGTVFGMADLVIFGVSENIVVSLIRNSSVIIAILWAYYLLYNDNGRTKAN